jgi:hypothetical protein
MYVLSAANHNRRMLAFNFHLIPKEAKSLYNPEKKAHLVLPCLYPLYALAVLQ